MPSDKEKKTNHDEEQELTPEERLERLGDPPVVPEEPGTLKSLFHDLFGWFDREFTERETQQRRLSEYNREKEELHFQIDSARRASDPETAKRAAWREQNNAIMEDDLNALEEKRAQAVHSYAPVVGRKLDAIFAEAEQNTDGVINRCRLVSIEDTCLEVLLREEYKKRPESERPLNEKGRPMDMGEYLDSIPPEDVNGLVAAALLSGRRVNYLTPDPKTGRVTNEEMKMLPKPEAQEIPGLSESDARRVMEYAHRKNTQELSETERHQRAVRNAELLKKVNYFDSMKVSSVFGSTVKKAFFGGWEAENGMKASQIETEAAYSKTRGGLSSMAVAYMICCKKPGSEEHYSIDEILDPNRFQKEKDEAGRVVMKKMQENDISWVAATTLEARQRMGEDLSERTKNTDFRDNASLYTESNRIASQEAKVLFDLSQDYFKIRGVKELGEKWFAEHGKTEEEHQAFKDDFFRKTVYYPTFFDTAYREKNGYAMAATGLDPLKALGVGVNGTYCREFIALRREANPKEPIYRLFALEDVPMASSVNALSGTNAEARKEIIGVIDPAENRAKAERMESGEYWKEYKVSFSKGEPMQPQFTRTKPAKQAEGKSLSAARRENQNAER